MTTERSMHLSLIVLGINGLKIPLANELSSAFNRGSQSGSLPSHQLTPLGEQVKSLVKFQWPCH